LPEAAGCALLGAMSNTIPVAAPARPVSAVRSRTQGFFLFVCVFLAACSGPTLRKDLIRDPPDFAIAPSEQGPLYELAQQQVNQHGDSHSGFHLLDGNEDALRWRLALIDSAVSSLDVQVYLWYADHSGRLVLDRAIRAADRGVKVRLLLDDLLTIGLDQTLYELEAHPNIQFRVFNPWGKRGLMQRAGEALVEMERLNVRMHDKIMIADGQAAIIGGRNIGDHYFGLHEKYNFYDLDFIGFGHIARQANSMFDHFWNSEWVVSAKNLELKPDEDFARSGLEQMRQKLAETPRLQRFSLKPRNWATELEWMASRLHPGTSTLIYDEADSRAIAQKVGGELFPWMGKAQHELLITNAYIIPAQAGIDFVSELTGRGVRVRILTNSLASHDVPAVNSHYRGWRDDFILAGAELHELRSDPVIQQSRVDTPPVQAKFTGLHTKAFVVDRRFAFIGSMNFDPRSININTEVGAFIDSPGLAGELAEIMERDMGPDNAWRVEIDAKGKLQWINSDEQVSRQPARGVGQRIMDMVFKLFPKELY
jgi:putative cardiolipin synthase